VAHRQIYYIFIFKGLWVTDLGDGYYKTFKNLTGLSGIQARMTYDVYLNKSNAFATKRIISFKIG